MVKLFKYGIVIISFIQFSYVASAAALFQDEFTAAGISTQWETFNQSDEFTATIFQPGDGFLYMETFGVEGNEWLNSGIEHHLDFSLPDFKVSVKVKASFGDMVGNKRGVVELIDNDNNSYLIMIGRDYTNTWKGQVCTLFASDVNSGCLNSVEEYTENELVEYTVIKYDSNIMIYMNGELIFSEVTEFNELRKVRIFIARNTEPGFFSVLFDSIEVNAIANCPSSQNGDVDAVVSDYSFFSDENGLAENSCLASNVIVVGGKPSEPVVIQEGADVNFAAPNGISLAPGVLIEHGSIFRAVSMPVQSPDQ